MNYFFASRLAPLILFPLPVAADLSCVYNSINTSLVSLSRENVQ